MKRENNFRVWCKDYQEWKKDYCFLSQDGQVYQMMKNGQIRAIRPENHVVQFFTGLFDKNSLPIFEGDIIKIIDGHETFWVEVVFEIGCYMGPWKNPLWYNAATSEVVGNVFENGELLK